MKVKENMHIEAGCKELMILGCQKATAKNFPFSQCYNFFNLHDGIYFVGCPSWHEENCTGGGADRRIGHTVTYDPEKKVLYVYGGSKTKRWFSDVNILDLQTNTWSAVKVS